ncbi:FAD-binding oxidoreductase [Mesobaculum littorinae]|uniref:FAD-binding oxidoreductase n=1 Tax=Mesobaculum littorinae TaxID=2486419 RepID=A0A438ALZ9_9RHOB|nr:FAD-binding oxidoreductase [Mesobaculum littorinae]RVV99778.1 FAD-binding oxidoreductase [Mesobaculum littorinae]
MRALWQDTVEEHVAAPPLDRDTEVDLVVIGAGFTGLSAALHASLAGARVCVIEAATVGEGGSGRNVGLVNAGLWTPPDEVEQLLGPQTGVRFNALLAAAPGDVFTLIEQFQIRCEARRAGTLHCAHAPSGLRDLRRRHAQLTARGAPVQLLDAAEARSRTGSAAVHGALFDPRAGTIQPLGYARGLARAAVSAGARLVEHTPAAWHRTATGWQVTVGGHVIRARALIEATNAYAGTPAARRRFAPMHYFQLATAPLPEDLRARILVGGEGCWDTAPVMSSFRMDAAGRLILGGIGALGHPAAGLHRDWAARKLRALFPGIAPPRITHAWHGRIAVTRDHLPKILRLGPGGYAVFGYSGRGIGPGTVFGRALARAAIEGSEDALPIPARDAYAEPIPRLRGAVVEAGALLVHATGLRRAG